jgi:hypothetical protein
MDEKQKNEIEEIMAKKSCSKDFGCFKDGFEKLCRARWMVNYTECLDAAPCSYKCGVLFGSGYVCQCELRQYVVKNLRR